MDLNKDTTIADILRTAAFRERLATQLDYHRSLVDGGIASITLRRIVGSPWYGVDGFTETYANCLDKTSGMPAAYRAIIIGIGNEAFRATMQLLVESVRTEADCAI